MPISHGATSSCLIRGDQCGQRTLHPGINRRSDCIPFCGGNGPRRTCARGAHYSRTYRDMFRRLFPIQFSLHPSRGFISTSTRLSRRRHRSTYLRRGSPMEASASSMTTAGRPTHLPSALWTTTSASGRTAHSWRSQLVSQSGFVIGARRHLARDVVATSRAALAPERTLRDFLQITKSIGPQSRGSATQHAGSLVHLARAARHIAGKNG